MPHAREQTRKAVAAAVTGLTTTDTNVFDSRVHTPAEMPCLSVYSLTEETDDASREMGTTEEFRTLTIEIHALAKAASGMDDELDTICAEVELAMGADSTLAGLVIDTSYRGVEIEQTDELDQPAGEARMEWAILYRTDGADPTTLIT